MNDSWLASLDAWKCTPPEDPPCYCGDEDCDECAQREARADAYDRHIDQQIDEARERDWDRP